VKLELELTDEQLSAIAERVAELVVTQERWLSQKELAEHFGCSVRTVSNYQRAGMPHLMIGSHPRYRASEVEAWLTARGGHAYDGDRCWPRGRAGARALPAATWEKRTREVPRRPTPLARGSPRRG
jgi:hypothetical protein